MTATLKLAADCMHAYVHHSSPLEAANMITTFLSLSGVDTDFVRGVHSHLPDGQTYYYPRSFTNGENLIEAMEERIGQSTIFVLFASKASAASHWVNFEIDRARIRSILNNKFKVLIFPIDTKVSRSDLPAWMGELWIPNAGQTQRDIARYIRNYIAFQEILESPTGRGYGRGKLTDISIQSFTNAVVTNGTSPNVLIFAGINGIGRRTFARIFVEQAFPASGDLSAGPQLSLPQFADTDDLYRALRQEVDATFSVSRFEPDRQIFLALSIPEQVDEIINQLKHFFDLGQAVTIITRNGIFEDRGILKVWSAALFSRLASIPNAKLLIIADRQAHENELLKLPNVIQFSVPPLEDGDIRSIIIAMAPIFGAKAVLPRTENIRAIGGHPAIAKMASRLIAQQGIGIFEDDPRILFDIQDDVIKSSLDVSALSTMEAEVLSILSWLPQLPGNSLTALFTARHSISRQQFAETLSGLILSCYIFPIGENYSISPAIRTFFRRAYGYGSGDLRKALYEELRGEWEKTSQDSDQRAELFDAFVFMSALEGGTLPPELQPLLLASTLQQLVRETYDSGHDDTEALERVVAWGNPARTMRMNETTREEILSYVARALIRLRGRDTEVDALLEMFLSRGYRSYHYINGFYLRRRNQIDKAIASFLEARKVRKYLRSVVGELADCYKIQAMWPQLRALIREQASYIDKNPYLLDIYVGMLIAEKDWDAAEAAIRRLKAAARNDGRAETRTASVMMQRDGKFDEAAKLLTQILSIAPNGRDNIRRVRAIAAANSNDLSTARLDLEHLKARPNGLESTKHIEANILLVEGNYDGALQLLTGLRHPSAQDRLLEARILDTQGHNPSLPLDERDKLKLRAAEIRARYSIVDEFDLEL